ncbi:MAG: beta-lactamase family protein [Lachnospiraceae bacterium]|nr:beta-lactamase family protein [Lachnospiraceae bacterium]
MFELPVSSPESVGIDSEQIERMIRRLQANQIPMHSILLMRHGQLVYEGYYKPYTKEKLHRMFSISKSMVSLGIGYLITRGVLHLDDKIVDYFPEKCPAHVHPYLQEMTLHNMLEMRTCYSQTTYKLNLTTDWVESFFIAEPDHPAGTIFHYDTSSPHVLCALVEKLAGVPFWDFMKSMVFHGLDISEDSYMLTDPNGVSMGGSGLMCTSMDLMKIGYFLSCKGTIFGETRVSERYIDLAMSLISPTIMKAPLPSEACGYGMQFWKTERNGTVCYGMGGQLLIMQPEADLICVTTADTQGYNGGNQFIYNAFYEEILDRLSEESLKDMPDTAQRQASLKDLTQTLAIAPVAGRYAVPMQHQINGKIYEIEENAIDVSKLSVSFDEDGGCLYLKTADDTWEIPFGFGECQVIDFPIYHMCAAASGAWIGNDCLYVKCHLCDTSVGSVHFQLQFAGNRVVVYMKKTEESLFHEFSAKHLIGYHR